MLRYPFECAACGHYVESSSRVAPACPMGCRPGMRRRWTAPNLSATVRGVKLPIHHGRPPE